ncbi:transposable element Tcb2 transposase [Trichonephila clavipes]|uniref:Transposable element Tcb2 transposase n=1 Tax=Trichonephila clavipes TaxID=2585209 RepID=A0A8X6R1F9_TRICX|nr:transposable element Tcb2 transposase [Trichonephila clavipes]
MQRLPGAIFEQDNAQPHTARVSQDCLRIVSTFPWPVQSSDLSPIKSVSDHLGCYTRAFGDGPRNFEPWSSDVDDT